MGATAIRPRLRADAMRNRERILGAARAAFVAAGTDVPLDKIARRAGVGNATLYRHFPDRTSLLYEVVLYMQDRITERCRTLLEAPLDPFDALSRALLASAEERIGALCTVVGVGLDRDDPRLVAGRERVIAAVQRLIDRAHAAGELREDVGPGDLLLAVASLTRPLPGTACHGDDDVARRHLQIFLDGLRTPARSRLPGRGLQLADLTLTKPPSTVTSATSVPRER